VLFQRLPNITDIIITDTIVVAMAAIGLPQQLLEE
jgi:hypothetical protein